MFIVFKDNKESKVIMEKKDNKDLQATPEHKSLVMSINSDNLIDATVKS